jgi:RND family efflux transporter MFP subunit
MTGEHRLSLSPGVAATAVVSVLLVGAGGTFLFMRDRAAPQQPTASSAASTQEAVAQRPNRSPAGEPSAASTRDVVVVLTKDAVDRAGIEITPVSTLGVPDELRLPGVIEPNAYRQVAVTPVVGGRVVQVSVQLGDRVRRGQPLAQVYSPELAEARTTYVAARAMLDAHDRELQRTQKLVEIGAASRQELERAHAEHAAQTAAVESARSRLQLLGAAVEEGAARTADENATITVPAPIDGVVIERIANVGLNVDPSVKLFTIVDLSNVWIIADVYERDLHRVGEGDRATVTTRAYPDLLLEGRVSYIDPQLNAGTRTAKVRVEVANPRGELRLGMYADVAIVSTNAPRVLSVPRSAIQNVGDRQVVYLQLASDAEAFVEREVRIGRSTGDFVEVMSGLMAGDVVASNGSFFLRAEVERLGLRTPQAQDAADRQPARDSSGGAAATQTATIAVTEKGYEPATVSLRAGVPARITFVRTTDKTCGTEIVFPSLNIQRALPLNEPVVIEIAPSRTGDIAFTCAMNMLHGTLAVR